MNYNILDTKTFSMNIENLVIEKGIEYLEAICLYCDENGIEIETAAKLLNVKIKATLELEASRSNLMKERNRELPFNDV